MLPDNMMGLTDEQIQELKLTDEWGEKCVPMDGWTFNKDVIGTIKIVYQILKYNKNQSLK